MALKDLITEYGVVSKIDVSSIEASTAWYEEKLELVLDNRFNTPGWWAQLYLPEFGPAVAVGLNHNPERTGTGGQRLTFVVDDIAAARQQLMDKGVEVGPINQLPHEVQEANFKDPDGNLLGLRQNSPEMPKASAIVQESRSS